MSALLDAMYSGFILVLAAAGVVYAVWSAGEKRAGGTTGVKAIAVAGVVVFAVALVGSLVLSSL